jgi:AAA family ATP:ADP antiporter
LEQLQWLFTATFLAMLAFVPLFGYVSARFPRHVLVPLVYLFFAVGLMIFLACFSLLDDISWAARVFYVWVSVYNLFVVSVFWSFVSDIFRREQGKRLFGLIAAGGSLGAVTGPTLAAWLAQVLGVASLLLVAVILLMGAITMVMLLNRRQSAGDEQAPALHGGILDGALLLGKSRFLQGIAVFIWLYTTLATFLYFQQAHLVAGAFDNSADRTSVFAAIDLTVNSLTIGMQIFIVGKIMSRAGLGTALAAVPVCLMLGFTALAAVPSVAVLIGVQILRRAGNYGVTRPAREVLYTTVERDARYKAKNFIDTVVYRGGDALAGWLFTLLKMLGLGIGGIALLSIPLAMLWGWIGYRLGRKADTR